jgi:hypothetical protein
MGNRQAVQRNVSGEESFIIGISTIGKIKSYKYKIDIMNRNQKQTTLQI